MCLPFQHPVDWDPHVFSRILMMRSPGSCPGASVEVCRSGVCCLAKYAMVPWPRPKHRGSRTRDRPTKRTERSKEIQREALLPDFTSRSCEHNLIMPSMLSSHYLWSSLVSLTLLVTCNNSWCKPVPPVRSWSRTAFFPDAWEAAGTGARCITIAFETGLHSPSASARGTNILWEYNNSLSCTHGTRTWTKASFKIRMKSSFACWANRLRP
jgi:hypothetical protein